MRTVPLNQPCHRSIVAVDIAGSTTRTNTEKIMLRRDIYDLFEAALDTTGIIDLYRDPLIDRGDGILALIHPVDHIPKTRLLDTLAPRLGALLAEHNTDHPHRYFRLRAVIHAGEVHFDPNGVFGEALDLAFRLLDAPQVRQQLRTAPDPLTLVVSDAIYQSIVRHGYHGIPDRAFEPAVGVCIAGRHHLGWLRSGAELLVATDTPTASTPAPR